MLHPPSPTSPSPQRRQPPAMTSPQHTRFPMTTVTLNPERVSRHLNGVHQPAHTVAVLPASATTRGDAWHVVVTPSDGVDDGAPETSNTLTVVNSLPVVTSIGVSSETPDTNDDVTFTFATDDDDGDPVTTEVRWLLDGSVVESMNDATTLPALATRPGDVWNVELRASDGFETSGWFSSPDVVIDSSNQAPTVSDLALNPMDAHFQ